MNTLQPAAFHRKSTALPAKRPGTFLQKCRHIFPIALLLLAMTACSTRKHAIDERESAPAATPATSKEAREMLERQSLSWAGSYSSKARFNFTLGQKNLSLNGTLRLKHDEALQISLQIPLLGTEAARIEATPERIIIIDRIHKRYVEEPIERLSALSGTGLNFYSLQALLSATLFQPGTKDFTLDDAMAMKSSTREAENIYRLATSRQGFSYTFDLDAASQRVAAATIAKTGSRYACTWQYAGYENTGSRAFPTRIKAQFNSDKTTIALELGLNKLEASDWKADTSPSSRYQRIELADILKLLSAL